MADIEGIVEDLTLDEKASLTAGEGMWSTVEIERLGIPKIQVTDGPNGARGTTVRTGTVRSLGRRPGSDAGGARRRRASWSSDIRT